MILKAINENLKMYSLESVITFLPNQKEHSDVLLTKTFENFSIVLTLNQKWPKSDFYGVKVIMTTFNENFKTYSLESVETLFVSQK